MSYTLISATPSPYARKVRITLHEKRLPFTLQTEVPWDSTTVLPTYNPLEKLPVLLPPPDSNAAPVYESHHILDWLEAKHPNPALYPSDTDDRLLAKQIEVIADGICDALVLSFFEKQRASPSAPWEARQMRKVSGGLRALSEFADRRATPPYLVGDALSVADVAAGCVLGYMAVRWPEHGWRGEYPQLEKYWEGLEARESFATTRPEPQKIHDRIV